MNAGLTQMRRVHHGAQGRFDRTGGVGQEIGDTGQGLVGFGVKHMQDRANQQCVRGLFPVVALVEAAFGIDMPPWRTRNVSAARSAQATAERSASG